MLKKLSISERFYFEERRPPFKINLNLPIESSFGMIL